MGYSPQRLFSLLAGGEQLEGVGVVKPDDGEMAAVEGRYLTLRKAFDYGEHCRVDEAESEVRVGDQEFAEPDVVAGLEILDEKGSALNVLQEAGEGAIGNEMVELNEHGRGNEPNAGPRPQQFGAGGVVLIVCIEQRDERPCVDYERNGGGS